MHSAVSKELSPPTPDTIERLRLRYTDFDRHEKNAGAGLMRRAFDVARTTGNAKGPPTLRDRGGYRHKGLRDSTRLVLYNLLGFLRSRDATNATADTCLPNDYMRRFPSFKLERQHRLDSAASTAQAPCETTRS